MSEVMLTEAPVSEATNAPTIKIKLVRSVICTPEKHKVMVRTLGLRRVNQVVVRPDSPGFRGIVKKIPHLLELVD
jgi:large subunit ribosomal protein L30